VSVTMNRPAPRLRGILVLTAALTALVAGPAAAQSAAPDETTTASADVETDLAASPPTETPPTESPTTTTTEPVAEAPDAGANDAEAANDVADDEQVADAASQDPEVEARDAVATDAGATTAAAVSQAACDPLTRLTPGTVDGDERAVTITSQTFDAGEPGWSAVQWEVDATVEATRLLIAHRDGSTVEAADPYRGFATDVLELTLCGRRAGTSGDDTAGEGSEDGAGTPDDGTPDTAGPDRDGSGGDTLPETGPTARVAALGATGLAMATAGLVLLRATTSPQRRRPHDATNLGGTA